MDIMLDENTFKSTYQIIKEISQVWSTLTDTTRANVTSLIAGKRNANVVQALMTNFEDAENAMQTAMDSAGSAFMENEKYLDSIAGKLDLLKAQWESFAQSVIGSGPVKVVADLATKILEVATALNKVHILLPAITAAIFGITGTGLVRDVTGFVSQIRAYANAGMSAADITTQLGNSMRTLSTNQKKLLVSMLQQTLSQEQLDQGYAQQIASVLGLQITEDGLIRTNTALAASNKAVGASFKAMWSAMPLVGQIGLVISLATTALSIFLPMIGKAEEDAVEAGNEIIDKFDKVEKTYQSNITTLNSLKDRYYELSRGVDAQGQNVSLTASEYEEYKGILQQIIDISPGVVDHYNAEGDAVLKYRDALSHAIAEQEELIANEREIRLSPSSREAVYKGAVQEYEDAAKGMVKASERLYKAAYSSGDLTYISDVIEKMREDGIDVIDPYAADVVRSSSAYQQALEKLYEHRGEFLAYLDSYTEEVDGKQVKVFSDTEKYQDALRDMAGEIGKMKTARDKAVNDAMEYMRDKSWYSVIPDGAIDELRGSVTELFNVGDDVEEFTSKATGFGEAFSRAIGSKSAKAITDYVGVLADGEGDVREELQRYEELVNGFGRAYERETGEMIDPDVVIAVVSYLRSLSDEAKIASPAIEETTESIIGLSDAISLLKTGEDILSKAKDEMRDYGTLSRDTISSIQSAIESAANDKDLKDKLPDLIANEKITDYLYEENGAIKLNEEAWINRSKAIPDNDVDAINSEIQALEEEQRTLRSYPQTPDITGTLQKNTDKLKELYALRELYQVSMAGDVTRLESMMSGLSTVESKASNLAKILNEIAGGTLQDWRGIVKQFPELMSMEGLFDVNTLSGQADAVGKLLQDTVDAYTRPIQDKIDELRRLREQETSGERIAEIDVQINNLEALMALGIELDTLDGRFDAIKAGVDNVVSAMKDSASELGINSEQVKQLTDRYRELDGFDAEKLFERSALGIRLNAQELDRLESAYQKQDREKVSDDIEGLKEQYQSLTQEMEKTSDVVKYKELFAERADIAKQINSLGNLAAQYDALISRYNAWKQAQSTGDAGDMYTDIYDNMKKMDELYKSGLVGKDDFRKYIELITGQDASGMTADQLSAAYKKAYPMMKKYFTDGSEGAERFLKDTEKINSEWAHQNKDGSWEINIPSDELAKELETSADIIDVMIGRLRDYGFDIDLTGTGEGLDKYVTDVDEAIDEVKRKMAELKENPDGLTAGQMAAQYKQLQNTLDTLEQMKDAGAIDLDSMTIDQAKDKIDQLIHAIATLKGANIQIPIQLTGQYNLLAQLLGLKSENRQTDTTGMFNTMPVVVDVPVETTWEDDWAENVWDGSDEPLRFDKMPIVVDEPLHIDDATAVADEPVRFEDMPIVVDEPLRFSEMPTVEDEPIDIPAAPSWEDDWVENVWDGDPVEIPVELKPDNDMQTGILDGAGDYIENAAESFRRTLTAGLKFSEIGEMLKAAQQSKEAAADIMKSFFGAGGLVDLISRVSIPEKLLSDVGWDIDPSDKIATVFSQAITLGENGEIGVVLTPILPNGDPLEPNIFDEAIENLIVGSDGKVDLSRADLGFNIGDILIAQLDLSDIPDELRAKYLDAFGEALHEVQDYYYGETDTVELPVEIQPEPTWEDDWIENVWDGSKEPVEVPVEPTWEDDWIENVWDGSEDPIIIHIKPEIEGGSPLASLDAGDINTAAAGGMRMANVATAAGVAKDAVSALTKAYFELYAAMDHASAVEPVDTEGMDAAAQNIKQAATDYWNAFNDVYTQTQATGNAPEIDFDANFENVMAKIAALAVPESEVVFNPDTEAVDAYAPEDKDAFVQFKADFTKVLTATVPKLKGTIEYTYSTVGQPPAMASGTAFAGGSLSRNGRLTKDVDALSGELGREGVVRDGQFFTVGNDGAEFTHFKRGDIIFNADQTDDLLKYGAIKSGSKRGRVIGGMPAFADGNTLSETIQKWFGVGKISKGTTTQKKKKSGSSSSTSTSSDKDDDKIDWIEIAIARIESAIDRLGKTASSAFAKITTRLSAMGKEAKKVREEIELQEKGAKRYLQEAEKVDLSADLKKRVREGAIDINEYDDDVQQKIQEYQKW